MSPVVSACHRPPLSPVAPSPAPAESASDVGLPLPPTDPDAPVQHDASTEELLDDVEQPLPPDRGPAAAVTSPLATLSQQEIADKLKSDPASLGSMSIGKTSGGKLFNGVRMPEGDNWTLIDPFNAWGTQETVDFLATAIDAVSRKHPDSAKMHIGHISAKGGGHLSPHLSHQSGRDVDISYFYVTDKSWYSRANSKNLDRERTWTFVRALITETDVEMILIDGSIQRLLREHALAIGEDPEWVDSVFQVAGVARRPLIRHIKGHDTHIHVRFYNPIAQSSARIAYQALIDAGKVSPPVYYVSHQAKKGDTLGSLAHRYDVTVKEIQQANGLRNTNIFAKKTYKIPKKGGVEPPSVQVSIPPRNLPPHPPTGGAAGSSGSATEKGSPTSN